MSPALSVPVTRTRTLNGHRFRVSHSRGLYGRLEATVTVPPQLLKTPDIGFARTSAQPHLVTYQVAVTPEFTLRSPWFSRLADLYDRYQGVGNWFPMRFFPRFDQLDAAIDRLKKDLRLPTESAEKALRQARRAGFSDRSEVLKHLAICEYEIAVLSGPFVEVIVRCLLAGTIRHDSVESNNRIRANLVSAWVAAGGPSDVTLPNDTEMARHYRQLLLRAETIRQVQMTNLGMDSSRYPAPARVNGREPAPDCVRIHTGSLSFGTLVTYGLELCGDHQLATGTIQLSPARFQAAKSLPDLPYGICLVVEIMADTKLLVRGAAGTEIDSRFARYLAGHSPGDTRPWLIAPTQQEQPPGWYVMPDVVFAC